MSVGRALIDYWRTHPSLSIRASLGPEGIHAFEREHSVALPDELTDYLLNADGFDAPGDQDRNGFTFYPLNLWRSVDKFEGGSFAFPGSRKYYVFADYLGLSWAYAVRLSESKDTRVILLGHESGKPRLVAPTFSEFVKLYLANDDALYGGSHEV